MLPAELAAALESGEWLSLRFGAGAGSDDEDEWLDRLGRLLPPDARVVGARLRRPILPRRWTPPARWTADWRMQNGIYRVVEDCQQPPRATTSSRFHYAIESDETSLGAVTVCLNASARSLAPQPEFLIEGGKGRPGGRPAAGRFPATSWRSFSRLRSPARSAKSAAWPPASNRAPTAAWRATAERIDSYYRDLLGQIEKRIARRAADPEAAEKERGRAAATQLDRAAKLEDLVRKYSLKIRIQPGDVLAVPLPVREISARLIRKKAERAAKLHWNPKLGALESPWCEGCSAPAHPLFLCDDRVHFLCKSCAAPCPACGKPFCRACQPRCKCGGA